MKITAPVAIAAAWFCGSALVAADKVDFATKVAPIFKERCLECHGPEKQKGQLRLDQKNVLFGHPEKLVVPGKADESRLYKLIVLPKGSDDIMPAKGEPLTKEQTDLIRDWINQGAEWPDGFVVGAAAPAAASAGPQNRGAAELRAAAAELRTLAEQMEAAAAKLEGKPAVPAKPEPTSEELAALAKAKEAQTQAMAEIAKQSGVTIRPLAMNVEWLEANFRVEGTNIADAALGPLGRVYQLAELNLAGTRITDAGLAQLQGLTNLATLHLENTGITDAGLAHLKNLTRLSYLNLYGTGVSDAGLEHLRGLTSLKKLYLWESKVTEEGAKKLQSALPNLQVSRGAELAPAKPEEKKP